MKFKKIMAVDNIGLLDATLVELKNYCDELRFYNSNIKDDNKLIEIIGNSDCLLVSWDTVISKKVIEECHNLKHIGMCCSLFDENSANIDVKAARQKGIIVTGVNDYGDNGVIEFVISKIIELLNGYGVKQWREIKQELTELKVGIIGLGTTGLMLAKVLVFFGADVYYYSRNKKDNLDDNIKYLSLNELLSTVDVISTHLPKNTIVLTAEKLKLYGNNKIIVNTSIGPTYDIKALKDWLKNNNNYLICDKVGAGDFREDFIKIENIIYADKISGQTNKSYERLSKSVLQNLIYTLSQISN